MVRPQSIYEEFANIRAACERALADGDVDIAVRIVGGLYPYNDTRHLPEIYGWLRQALDLPDAPDHALGRHALLHR